MKYTFLNILLIIFITPLFSLDRTVGTSGTDYIVDGTADEIEIQLAVNEVSASVAGGTVFLSAGTYHLSSRIEPRSNVEIQGADKATTIIQGTHTYDYLLFNIAGPISNFTLKEVTINPQNAERASGIRLENVTDVTIMNVDFINVSCDGWHMVVGVKDSDAALGGITYSERVLIDGCTFDGHQGSLEMLLLYNLKNALVHNCMFKNKTAGCPSDGNRPVLGFWQFTHDVCVENCTFLNNDSNEAVYYSNTCTNTCFRSCTFNNTGAITGANISDFGPWHGNPSEGLVIRDSDFIGGANDLDGAAIVIGAVNNVLIENCNIEEYVLGILYHGGYGGLSWIPKNVAVVNTTIQNCNNTENFRHV